MSWLTARWLLMVNQILLDIILIHIFIAILYFILIRSGVSNLRNEYILPILLLPMFGVAIALAIDLTYLWGKPGQKTVDLESLKLEDDIYWRNLKLSQEDKNIVPLEEAILIDDIKTRRKAVLLTLEDEPLKYLDILLVARNNKDVDTVHYATTQITKVQRFFQIEIEKYTVAIEKDPDNFELLDKAIDLYEKYIASGLLEEPLLKRSRIIYNELLDKKLALISNDKYTLIKKLRNCINLKTYASAFEISDVLRTEWPKDEIAWIEALRVCVEGQDYVRLHKIVNELKDTPVNWTKQGKQQVNIWLGT